MVLCPLKDELIQTECLNFVHEAGIQLAVKGRTYIGFVTTVRYIAVGYYTVVLVRGETCRHHTNSVWWTRGSVIEIYGYIHAVIEMVM